MDSANLTAGVKRNRSFISLFAVAAVAACLLRGQAHADTTFTTVGTKFNTLFQESADPPDQLAAGASANMYAGVDDDGNARRALIQFDLSSIPADAVVTSASLTIYYDRSNNGNVLPATLYRMSAAWGQGTSGTGTNGGGGGSPATQNDATWLYTAYNAGNPSASPTWANPGGDYAATSSATVNIQGKQGTVTPYTWSGSGVTADVQAWINNSAVNYGWMIQGDETQADTTCRFESALTTDLGSNGVSYAVSVLTVTYSIAAPEPTTTALLGSGVLLGVVRRRRRAA